MSNTTEPLVNRTSEWLLCYSSDGILTCLCSSSQRATVAVHSAFFADTVHLLSFFDDFSGICTVMIKTSGISL